MRKSNFFHSRLFIHLFVYFIIIIPCFICRIDTNLVSCILEPSVYSFLPLMCVIGGSVCSCEYPLHCYTYKYLKPTICLNGFKNPMWNVRSWIPCWMRRKKSRKIRNNRKRHVCMYTHVNESVLHTINRVSTHDTHSCFAPLTVYARKGSYFWASNWTPHYQM